MTFNFGENEWGILTADWATMLVAHLPQNIWSLEINHDNFGRNFMETFVQRVEKSSKMEYLCLYDIKSDGNNNEELRLVEMISFNNTIKNLLMEHISH